MMTQPPISSDNAELRDVWCSAARSASDAQLVACVAIAILVALTFAVLLFVDVRRTLSWWPVLLLGLLAGAFGTWGIADRELSGARPDEERLSRRTLSALKLCSAVAAGAVGVLAALGILRLTIGTWIS
jgi:hypothetical protein